MLAWLLLEGKAPAAHIFSSLGSPVCPPCRTRVVWQDSRSLTAACGWWEPRDVSHLNLVQGK